MKQLKNKVACAKACPIFLNSTVVKLTMVMHDFVYLFIISRLIYCIPSSDLCTLLTSSEYNRLSSESRELLWSSCELAQIRCSKLIAMRSKVTISVLVPCWPRDNYKCAFQAIINSL